MSKSIFWENSFVCNLNILVRAPNGTRNNICDFNTDCFLFCSASSIWIPLSSSNNWILFTLINWLFSLFNESCLWVLSVRKQCKACWSHLNKAYGVSTRQYFTIVSNPLAVSHLFHNPLYSRGLFPTSESLRNVKSLKETCYGQFKVFGYVKHWQVLTLTKFIDDEDISTFWAKSH